MLLSSSCTFLLTLLQIAEQTVDIGSNALVEINRQGLQLERADQGVENMEKDVLEASRIMKFMRRWCCFQIICCCDCFDADVDLNRTRKQRLQLRKQQQAVVDDALQARALGYQMSIRGDTTINGHDFAREEKANRSELLSTAAQRSRTTETKTIGLDIGVGLPEADREEIMMETGKQDAYLDQIGHAVESLKSIGLEMQEELQRQEPQIDSISERIHVTHENLGNLSRQARRI